jgi:hypothetical protein
MVDRAVRGHGLPDQLRALVTPGPVAQVAEGRGRGQHLVLPARDGGGDRREGAVDLVGDALGGGVVAQHAHQSRHHGPDEREGEGEPRSQASHAGCRTV